MRIIHRCLTCGIYLQIEIDRYAPQEVIRGAKKQLIKKAIHYNHNKEAREEERINALL